MSIEKKWRPWIAIAAWLLLMSALSLPSMFLFEVVGLRSMGRCSTDFSTHDTCPTFFGYLLMLGFAFVAAKIMGMASVWKWAFGNLR